MCFQVVDSLDISPQGTRVGLVQYSSRVRTEFPLNMYHTAEEIKAAVMKVWHHPVVETLTCRRARVSLNPKVIGFYQTIHQSIKNLADQGRITTKVHQAPLHSESIHTHTHTQARARTHIDEHTRAHT